LINVTVSILRLDSTISIPDFSRPRELFDSFPCGPRFPSRISPRLRGRGTPSLFSLYALFRLSATGNSDFFAIHSVSRFFFIGYVGLDPAYFEFSTCRFKGEHFYRLGLPLCPFPSWSAPRSLLDGLRHGMTFLYYTDRSIDFSVFSLHRVAAIP